MNDMVWRGGVEGLVWRGWWCEDDCSRWLEYL